MQLAALLQTKTAEAVQALYQLEIAPSDIQITTTDAKFEGNFTVVVFPIVKAVKKKPQDVADEIGQFLVKNASEVVVRYNAVQGFVNLTLSDAYWLNFLQTSLQSPFAGHATNGKTIVVEYSSPNTNKPLHLGHIRNNLLGYAASQVFAAAGFDVKKVQIINDRGVHICKSMLAWQLFGNSETPQSANIKGDHLVGKYYVEFENQFQKEYKEWQTSNTAKNLCQTWLGEEKNTKKATSDIYKDKVKQWEKTLKETTEFENDRALKTAAEANATNEGVQPADLEKYYFKEVYKNTYFNEYSVLGKQVKQMLQAWEQGDKEVVGLWQMMNSWVYDGFATTYKNLGVSFDKLYYESNTYLTGKELVERSLQSENSIFYKEADGSVWIDLSDVKLDKKAVLRNDGTSMYITQDLGTAYLRFQDFDMDNMIYVVGNEQDYHFQVLFEILKRLGYKFASQCHHLSYGMVNLTTGKMKSREGTVVDADDLMAELVENVQAESAERSTLEGETLDNKQQIWHDVALGALKFYILKVEPKKSMVFDPKQSIDLQGQTGPYIQNAYVRTCGIKRKAGELATQLSQSAVSDYVILPQEKDLLQLVHALPSVVKAAADAYNPAEVANYLYNLARAYHKFYNDVVIVDKNDATATKFRLQLNECVAHTLKYAGSLLGINMPERM